MHWLEQYGELEQRIDNTVMCRYEPEQLEGNEEALREDFRKVLKHRDFKLRLAASNLLQRQDLYDKRAAAIIGKSARRKQSAQQAA